MFDAILEHLTKILGPKTFYHAKVKLEMSRCKGGKNEDESFKDLEEAKNILLEQFGESHSVFNDYLVGKVEFLSRTERSQTELFESVETLLGMTEANNMKKTQGNSMLMI